MTTHPTHTRHPKPKTFSRRVAPFAPLALALAMKAVNPAAPPPPPPEAAGAEAAVFAQACASPHFPSPVATAMDNAPCGIDGKGGKETWQNEAKNNFCAPDPPIPTTIAQLIALQQAAQAQDIPFGRPAQHPNSTEPGPATDRSPLVALGEGQQIVLQGFVKIARQEGGESVNCGKNVPDKPEFHDIHISIVQNLTDAECDSVVAEMTPHHRPPAWTAERVNQVAKAKLWVRVTGQRFFDSSHSTCQNGTPIKGDPSRVSLWEIHPIYDFEVCPTTDCTTGGWIPLEKWKP